MVEFDLRPFDEPFVPYQLMDGQNCNLLSFARRRRNFATAPRARMAGTNHVARLKSDKRALLPAR